MRILVIVEHAGDQIVHVEAFGTGDFARAVKGLGERGFRERGSEASCGGHRLEEGMAAGGRCRRRSRDCAMPLQEFEELRRVEDACTGSPEARISRSWASLARK